jgi:hypothetical protein
MARMFTVSLSVRLSDCPLEDFRTFSVSDTVAWDRYM